MTFEKFSSYLKRLEETTLRNKMVEILAELFIKAKVEEDLAKIEHLFIDGLLMPENRSNG